MRKRLLIQKKKKSSLLMAKGEKLIVKKENFGPNNLIVKIKDPATGKPVGVTHLVIEENKAEIVDLIVAEKFRRTGLGEFLLSKAITEAAEKGVNEISLWVSSKEADREAALNLYRKMGFKPTRVDQNRLVLKNPKPKHKKIKKRLNYES